MRVGNQLIAVKDGGNRASSMVYLCFECVNTCVADATVGYHGNGCNSAAAAA